MLAVTLHDLRFRSRQFAIAVIGAGLLFATALLLTGMANGFRVEARKTVEGVGADAWIVPNGSTGPFTSAAAIPKRIVDRAENLPGVEAAYPLAIVPQTVLIDGKAQNFRLFGHHLTGPGAPRATSGRDVAATGEAVVDARLGLDVGDTLTVGALTLDVVGRVSGYSLQGGIPSVYLAIDDVREVAFGGNLLATAIVTEGVPESAPAGYTLMTNREVQDDAINSMSDAVASLDNSRTLMWVVAAVIVAALMYVSSLERTRDFAVLKSLGSSSSLLFFGVAIQAIIVTLLAAGVAVGGSRFLRPMFPLPIFVPSSAYLVLPLVALGVGLLSSLVALRRAVSVDPAVAFSGAA